MPALDEAQTALAAGHDAHSAAKIAADTTAAEAARLRGEVASGQPSKITPQQLAQAAQAAEHAALVAQGTAAALPALSAAVQAARADEVCDRIADTLPELGKDVVGALSGVEAALEVLVDAVQRYDRFAETAVHQLAVTVHSVSSRAQVGRLDAPSVDGIPLSSCRGWNQVASLLLPIAPALGAHIDGLEGLKQLAQTAPQIPTGGVS